VAKKENKMATCGSALRALLWLGLALQPLTANVIGIDFGGDNIKVGMIAPGKFDIGTLPCLALPSPESSS
jgi:hypothetical protein